MNVLEFIYSVWLLPVKTLRHAHLSVCRIASHHHPFIPAAIMPAAALLLVDVQNDFLPPTGALAVPDGRDILPTVHALLDDDERWQAVFASQDYHPRGHVSFASRYPGSEPYTSRSVRHPVTGDEISQELWPDHCVQGTSGCEFEAGVWKRIEKRSAKRGPQAVRIIRKVS